MASLLRQIGQQRITGDTILARMDEQRPDIDSIKNAQEVSQFLEKQSKIEQGLLPETVSFTQPLSRVGGFSIDKPTPSTTTPLESFEFTAPTETQLFRSQGRLLPAEMKERLDQLPNVTDLLRPQPQRTVEPISTPRPQIPQLPADLPTPSEITRTQELTARLTPQLSQLPSLRDLSSRVTAPPPTPEPMPTGAGDAPLPEIEPQTDDLGDFPPAPALPETEPDISDFTTPAPPSQALEAGEQIGGLAGGMLAARGVTRIAKRGLQRLRGGKKSNNNENADEAPTQNQQEQPSEVEPAQTTEPSNEAPDPYAALTDVEDEDEPAQPAETDAPAQPDQPAQPAETADTDTPAQPTETAETDAPAPEAPANSAPAGLRQGEPLEGGQTGDQTLARIAEEGTETAAETTAETTAETAANVLTKVPEAATLAAGSEGFLNPILDGASLVAGVAGLLFGSGIFSKPPPTPTPPKKIPIPTTTVSQQFGGGEI